LLGVFYGFLLNDFLGRMYVPACAPIYSLFDRNLTPWRPLRRHFRREPPRPDMLFLLLGQLVQAVEHFLAPSGRPIMAAEKLSPGLVIVYFGEAFQLTFERFSQDRILRDS